MPKGTEPCDKTCRHGGQRPIVSAPEASPTMPRPKPTAGADDR